MTIGALESARSDFETVLALASSPTSTSHDVGEQWQAFLDLGFAWDGIDYERTRSYYQQAFDLAQSSGKPLLIARSSNRIGNWHMNMEQPEEGLRYQQQALAIFVQANATEDIIENHILIHYSGLFVGDLVGLSHFRQAIALARQSDNRYGLSAARGDPLCSPMHSTDTMLSTLSLDEASDHVEEAGQLARTIGWRLNEAITSTWRAGIANARGDFGAARRFAEEGVAIAEEMAHPEWQSSNLYELGNIASDTYDYDAAKAYLEHALGLAKEMRSLHFQRVMAGRLAGVLALSGQCEGARATLARVVAPDEPMLTPGQRECWYGYARIALSEGNPRTALDILQRLASAASAPAFSDVPWLALLGGEALLDLGHFEEAATLLGDAYRVAQAEEWRLLIWRLGALWGRALYARGAVDEAAQIWAESRTYAETLAASIPKESERAAFLQGVSTAIPTLTTLSLPQSPRQPPRAAGDLTRRELEIARLVALGQKNRQIARALIISEETATVHVKHILHKLQFTSRSQIAAWVVDQRLDISPDR
jgi:DNA-binding CsgD family transcriptional regulator